MLPLGKVGWTRPPSQDPTAEGSRIQQVRDSRHFACGPHRVAVRGSTCLYISRNYHVVEPSSCAHRWLNQWSAISHCFLRERQCETVAVSRCREGTVDRRRRVGMRLVAQTPRRIRCVRALLLPPLFCLRTSPLRQSWQRHFRSTAQLPSPSQQTISLVDTI